MCLTDEQLPLSAVVPLLVMVLREEVLRDTQLKFRESHRRAPLGMDALMYHEQEERKRRQIPGC